VLTISGTESLCSISSCYLIRRSGASHIAPAFARISMLLINAGQKLHGICRRHQMQACGSGISSPDPALKVPATVIFHAMT
jgi:hypothetical protein